MLLKPLKLKVSFFRVRMNRIDVTPENRNGNMPGFKNRANSPGVSRTETSGRRRIGKRLR
jgi:hypothetical protein